MRSSPQLYKIWCDVHQQARVIGKKTPSLVDARIVDWAKQNGSYDQVKQLVGKFLAKEKLARDGVKQMSLAPPRSSELYERVSPKAKIVDVGCGDGKRLARYAGYFGDVLGVEKDHNKKPVLDWPKNWRIDYAEFVGTDRVITSFLSYTQFDPPLRLVVENHDGIHVLPNHDELRKLGVVKELTDGRVESDMGKEKFVEYDVGISGGERLRSYYFGYNTYVERNVKFDIKARSKFSFTGCKYFVRMQRDLFVDDFTPKYNGVFMELRVAKGKFIMKDSIGSGLWGNTDAPDMVLHLEALKDKFVLLRVEKYRDLRPFHSLDMLEKFCSRVKFTLLNKNVVPPERIKNLCDWQKEFPSADGVVCRDGGMDYVMNCGIHLDLKPDKIDVLTTFMREKQGSKTVVHQGSLVDDVVYEVCCVQNDLGAALCVWKPRRDKLVEDDYKSWIKKFKLLTIEKYLLKFERKKETGGMNWDEDDGTDD